MSKKLIIGGAAVAVAIVATLPLIGNMSVEKVTQERISMLEQHGIKVEQSDNGSSYFATKSHYVFTLEDAEAFENYLATLSEAQVPAYLSTMLNDVVMGADVEYSNVLISSDISLDLYPVAFSKEATVQMQSEDKSLYEQMTAMLQDKTFMYHMNYDIAGSKFDGYVKDVNQKITFDDGKTANLVFEGATFVGDGTLVEPKNVDFKIRNVDVDFILPDASNMQLQMHSLETRNSFTSKNSFDLNYKAESFHLFYKDLQGEITLDAKDMNAVSDSKVSNAKLSTNINATMKSFKMNDLNGSLSFENFTFVMDAVNIDQKAYEAFQKASEQVGASSQYTMLAGVGILAKGFSLHVKELSVDKLAMHNSGMMKGFSHKMDLVVKPDDALVQKIQTSPMAIMQNIDLDAKLNFSSAFYAYVKQQNQNLGMADVYAKKDGKNVLFDIMLKEGKLSVNGQSL